MAEKFPQPVPAEIPEYVYRAVTVSPDQLTDDFFKQDLVSHTKPVIDAQGRPTVADGNEYGVYTTTNQRMADTAYGTPRHGDTIAASPNFRTTTHGNTQIETPRIGVTYRIKTEGLDLRQPFITRNLQGVYNNGFQGKEFIADRIPAKHVEVAGLRLGPDTLHKGQEYPLRADGLEATVEQMKADVAVRSGKLAIAHETIAALPEDRRRSEFIVDRALKPLKGPGKL